MRRRNWIVGLAIIVAALLFLGFGLTNVSVENFEITGVDEVSADSFILTGNLFIDNPALLSVPVERGEYAIVLRSSKETLSKGTIPGFTLKANQMNEVDFSHEVNWKPTLSLALQLLTQNQVYADVKGNVTVSVIGTNYKVPFTEEVDIKGYLRQYLNTYSGTLETDSTTNTIDEETDSVVGNLI